MLDAALSASDPDERLAALDVLLPALEGRALEQALQRRRAALAERDVVELEELAPEELPAVVAAAAAIADDVRRADALLSLAERIEGEPLDREIVAALRALVRRDDVLVLAQLAPRIPTRLLGQVLAAVLELEPWLRDEQLADLAPVLDAELAAVALAHADVDDVFLRALLAAGLPEAERAAAGERALEAVAEADPYVRDVRLAQLAEALPDALVWRALELADADQALAALVPRLGEDRVRDAFALATGSSALLALAPRLPDDLVRPAFDAAAACTGGDEAIAALAPRLPDDLVRPAFDAVAACTGGDEAMAALARRLPDDALDDALAAAGASAPVLAVLAPRLSEAQLRDALRIVGRDRWALATLAPHLPASLLAVAVIAANAGSSSGRAFALALVAPFVDGAADAALRADPDVYVLARVAPFLPPPEREARLLAALEALEELPADERHGVAVALLPHLSGERRARALAHVDLSAVTSTDVDVLLDDLSDADVARLVEQLDPFEDEELLEALAPRLTLNGLLAGVGRDGARGPDGDPARRRAASAGGRAGGGARAGRGARGACARGRVGSGGRGRRLGRARVLGAAAARQGTRAGGRAGRRDSRSGHARARAGRAGRSPLRRAARAGDRRHRGAAALRAAAARARRGRGPVRRARHRSGRAGRAARNGRARARRH